MTPEERMRLLRNHDEWTFTLARRASPFPARRQLSPWLVSLSTVAAVAVVGVIVFSVFGLGIRSARPVAPPVVPTQTSVPTPVDSPTPSSTATPPETPDPSAGAVPAATTVSRPKQVFGGDCNNIYTEAQLSALTGEKMSLYSGGKPTDEFSGQLVFALEQAGGLSCAWGVVQKGGGFSSTATQVNFFIAPASAAKPLAKELTCGPPYNEGMYGPGMCGIEHDTHGIRFSGGVLSSTKAKGHALSAAVIAHLDQRAAASPFTASAPAAGSWANPVDCDAVSARLDVSTLFGDQGTFGGDQGGHGAFGPSLGKELTGLYENTTCEGTAAEVASYDFGVMGGGGWVRDEFAGKSPVTIAGIGEAYVKGKYLFVFTGPNLISFRYTDLANNKFGDFATAAPQLRAVVAALDSLQ